MRAKVEWGRKTYKDVLALYESSSSNNLKTALARAINNANGQLASALHEVSAIMSADAKKRKVGAQKYGDVHVGRKKDVFAKTVELKSKTDVYPTNVDKEIKKGLKQLQGLTGYNPRVGDIWVLDVAISNELNQWPYGTPNAARPAVPLQTLINKTQERLVAQIKAELTESLLKYINGGTGRARALQIDQEQRSWDWDLLLNPTYTSLGQAEGTKSTRPIISIADDDGNVDETVYLHALTIKIRFTAGNPYPIAPPEGLNNAVSELKFQISSEVAELAQGNINTRLKCVGRTLCQL